jgi:general secretion pathway protein G
MAPTIPIGRSGAGLPACALALRKAISGIGVPPVRPDASRKAAPHAGRPAARGFTFIEMMVVITLIVILITIAIPIYQKSIIRAREAVLHNNLTTLREVIDHYTYDKEKAPQTLQDLVSDGYLKKVPMDPITNTDDWKLVMEDATQAVNQSEPGIFDVHSTSDKISLDGTPYSSW